MTCILPLDRNEYFFPHPKAVCEALARASRECHRYTPSSTHESFRTLVAGFLGVASPQLTLGHGGEDLLVKILAWQRRWKSVLIRVDFSWQTYTQIGGGLDYAIREVPSERLGQRFVTPENAMHAALSDSDPAVVVLTSPNNPTGHTLAPETLERLAREFPRHLFLIDAVYDVPRTSFLRPATTLDNVVLVGSFSKFFGLPGIRVGYAVSPTLPPGLALVLGLPPSAVAAAEAALGEAQTYLAHREAMLAFAQTLLALNMDSTDLRIYETAAPFVLCSLKGTLAENTARLEALVETHGARPKIFELEGETWLRFGLGPREVQDRIAAFLDHLRKSSARIPA